MRGLIATILFFFSSTGLIAENQFSHEKFDQILKEYVLVDGTRSYVDYSTLKDNRKPLDQYVESLSQVRGNTFRNWNSYDQLAFLINAYNALTLQLVINYYPIESIKDAGSDSSSAWKKEFFILFGKKCSLDFLEHHFIRKRFNEPRIHFALVCAAKGCPPLKKTAYDGANLKTQLEEQAQLFLQDRERNYYDPDTQTLYLSKLFAWFTKDFEFAIPGQRRTLLDFVAPYMTNDYELPPAAKVKFLPYNWELNDTKNLSQP